MAPRKTKTATTAPGELLTIEQFAARLNVSTRTVRRMLEDGTVRFHRISGRNSLVRIDAAELAKVLD